MSNDARKSAGRKATKDAGRVSPKNTKKAAAEIEEFEMAGPGRPKGSFDRQVASEREEFVAAVAATLEGAAPGRGRSVNAAVEAVQASREARGKAPYTDSTLRQTLGGWARQSGYRFGQVQRDGQLLWAASRKA